MNYLLADSLGTTHKKVFVELNTRGGTSRSVRLVEGAVY